MQMARFDVSGKLVLVAGGSKGLGREICLELTRRGASVTAIARSSDALAKVKQEMEAAKLHADQVVSIKSLDLLDYAKVFEFINGHSTPIFAVFCVAGGTDKEIGYFTDIKPADIRDCMENNYFTTANTAHAIMKHWTAQDIGPAVEESCAETFPTAALAEHHLILTASTAAVISIPGYAAYSPAKAAVRALADTLRQEAFLHNSKRKKIHIHCTLPGTIYTESFYREQGKKPTLCKRIEGTLDNRGGLHVSDVTNRIFQALTKGRFLITTDWQTRLLLGVMRGASPAGSWMVLDLVLTILAGTLAPFATWYLDRMIQDSARQMP